MAHVGKVQRGWVSRVTLLLCPHCCPPPQSPAIAAGSRLGSGAGGLPPALTPLLPPSPGIYVCAKCGHELFSSRAKYEHSSPWPAFTETVHEDSVSKRKERPGALKALYFGKGVEKSSCGRMSHNG